MILITGSSGFIGSKLLEATIQAFGKDKVVAFTSRHRDDCNYVLHKDYQFSNDYLSEEGYGNIDTVIHVGAFTPKTSHEANDVDRSTSNIINTHRLLSALNPKLKRFIYLSTIDVYEPYGVITEASPVAPVSLYGDSKYYCEKMVESWAKEHGISCIILRIGHVYGPGEEAYKKLIPTVMRQIINGNSVKLFGDGEDLRSFIYITDVVQSIVNSIQITADYEIVNIVGDSEIKIKNLIESIIRISERQITVEHIPQYSNPRNLVFNNSKLKMLLHTPAVSLNDGLKLEWDYLNAL